MRRHYLYFNLTCLFLSILFVLGILWLWKGSFVNLRNKNIPVTVMSKKVFLPDGIKDIENIKPVENLELAKKIEENLPKEINLAVPFTSQAPEENWDLPWQEACEEATALMLDAYYKNYNLSPLFARDEIVKMVEWEEQQGWGVSIEITKIKDLMVNYLSPKYKVKIIENPTVEQIKKYLANGQPVFVVADGKVLPNPHFRNGGPVYHTLIIRGYTSDSFITNDPGTKFGENFLYKHNDLLNAIHDWNGGNVKEGKRSVLTVDF